MKTACAFVALVLGAGGTREATVVPTRIDVAASGSLLLSYRIENRLAGPVLAYDVAAGSAWPRQVEVQARDVEQFVAVRQAPERQCKGIAVHRLGPGDSVEAIQPVTGLGARTIRFGFAAAPAVDGDRMLWSEPLRPCDLLTPGGGVTALMCAAARGDLDALQSLLVGDGDLDARDANGSSALHYAAAFGQAAACEALLAAGADVDARTTLGFTPARVACRNNALDAARVLHEAGADFHGCRVEATVARHRDHDPRLAEFLAEIGAR
jgi:hypothetical protein